MSSFPFTGKYFALSQLVTEIVNAGLDSPLTQGFGFSSDNAICSYVILAFPSDLSAQQFTSLQSVVAAHSPTVPIVDKLDLASTPTNRALMALVVLSATSATLAQKTRAQAIVDVAYNQIVNLLS